MASVLLVGAVLVGAVLVGAVLVGAVLVGAVLVTMFLSVAGAASGDPWFARPQTHETPRAVERPRALTVESDQPVAVGAA